MWLPLCSYSVASLWGSKLPYCELLCGKPHVTGNYRYPPANRQNELSSSVPQSERKWILPTTTRVNFPSNSSPVNLYSSAGQHSDCSLWIESELKDPHNFIYGFLTWKLWDDSCCFKLLSLGVFCYATICNSNPLFQAIHIN